MLNIICFSLLFHHFGISPLFGLDLEHEMGKFIGENLQKCSFVRIMFLFKFYLATQFPDKLLCELQ